MTPRCDLRFGVEVELSGLTADHAATALDECLADEPGSCDGFTITTDRSVPDGFELRSPPLALGDLGLLERVFRSLRNAGATPETSHAGIHVHVDTDGFSARQLASLVVSWAAAEPSLRRALDVHPRRSLRYCRPVERAAAAIARATTVGDLLDIWSAAFGEGPGRPAKQRSLNLESHAHRGTVEFRLFNSASTSIELRRCIAIALGFTRRARQLAPPVRLPAPASPWAPTITHERGRDDAVAFAAERAWFRAPTYNGLLHQLLDAGFIEIEATGWFEHRVKGETELDRRARRLIDGTGTPTAETYARAAVLELARRGCGVATA